MIKKILIAAVILILISAAVIFIYRYQILKYSAESFIRKSLPDYIKIDKIDLKPQESKLVLRGFKILNPSGYSNNYLLEIEEVVCAYRMKGKSFTDGIEILEPIIKKAVLGIERVGDGSINIMKMQELMGKNPAGSSVESAVSAASVKEPARQGMVGGRKISDIVKIPESFSLIDARVAFIDRMVQSNPHMITLDRIKSTVTLKLDDLYSRILGLASSGEGVLNGNEGEIVRWNIALDPTTPRLTMSNRLDASNLDILPFEPYYDKYSPLVFKSGRFSGTLIFDFDNGNIGSTNELHLVNVKFYVKPGYENAQFWETTVPDLVKYFTSPYGEIVFDFKIKGDISEPKFFLGPISKQALTSMAIDKISNAIQQVQQGDTSKPKNDVEKVKEYIDLFKDLVNKK